MSVVYAAYVVVVAVYVVVVAARVVFAAYVAIVAHLVGFDAICMFFCFCVFHIQIKGFTYLEDPTKSYPCLVYVCYDS